ncbi:MAG: Fpg/Nei family DNA glycosylase [Actinomycetales bacterium]
MPEGHVTHGLAREHRKLLGGRIVHASSPQGRFAAGASRIDGRELVGTDAVGKHLFHRYRDDSQPGPDDWLHVHLGLYGKFSVGHGSAPAPVGQVRLRLEGGGQDGPPVWMDLRGPTACELLTAAQVRQIRDRLGPDPLRRGASPEAAWQRIHRSRTAIGALLMDQSVLAGVGNVFRAEVLYRHGVDPHRPGMDLDHETWDAMWTDLVGLMRAALRTGRIVTTEPADRPSRRVTRETAHYVYRRAGLACRRCGTPIATEVLAGRNLFWCPRCQA